MGAGAAPGQGVLRQSGWQEVFILAPKNSLSMKNALLLIFFCIICLSVSAQSIWHNIYPLSSTLTQMWQVRLEEDQYFIRSTEFGINVSPDGSISGYMAKDSAQTGAFMAATLKKYNINTGDPYFLTAHRPVNANTGYTLSEFRPGTGYLHSQLFADSLGFINFNRPKVLSLNDHQIAAFGRQFFRKLSFSQTTGFEELWIKPLPKPVFDVIFNDNYFIVAEDMGRVYALDTLGNEVWSVTYPMTFNSIRAIPGGFAGCPRNPPSATVVKMGSSGSEIWTKSTTDRVYTEAVGTSDGGIAAVGLVGTADTGNIVLIKFDANGEQVWRKEYGKGTGLGLVAAPDGGFVLIATSTSSSDEDFLHIIKTDADGNTGPVERALFRQRVLQNDFVKAFQFPSTKMLQNDNRAGLVSSENGAAMIYSSFLWMGGLDGTGTKRVSAGFENTSDSRAGLNNLPFTDFHQVWMVQRDEINDLRRDFGLDHAINEPVPVDLLRWPAKGNPHFRYNLNFAPVTTSPDQLPAPFVDVNNDGIYNVYDGDYPQIKGDQMMWWVQTDSVLAGTGDPTMGLNFVYSAYLYNCPQTDLINRSVFVEVDVINRSGTNYSDTYAGLYTDVDLGCPQDDYIGSIPAVNAVFAYNLNAVDEACDEVNPGWGDHPPVQSITFSNLSLDHSLYNNSSSSPGILGLGYPSSTTGRYNNLQGKWRDGTALTSGGSGYNQGSTSFVDHAFPGNPSDPQGWSMCNAGIEFGDLRVFGSHGPFSFIDGDTLHVKLQFTTHQNVPMPCPNITATVQPGLEQLQEWHDDGALYATVDLGQVVNLPAGQSATLNAAIPGATAYAWSTGAASPSIEVEVPGTYSVVVTRATGCELTEEVLVQLASGIQQPFITPEWSIQPNPATDLVMIQCPDCSDGNLRAVLRNAQGAEIVVVNGPSRSFQLQTRDQSSGFYWLDLWQNGQFIGSKKLVLGNP